MLGLTAPSDNGEVRSDSAMLNILVTLEVKDFDLLADFESKAIQVMHFHGGSMVRAFETIRNQDGSGQEVHLLEFPTESAFRDYRSDSRLLAYAELRDRAILSTQIIKSDYLKSYE